MADEMGDRHSLIVFPEGTRGTNGEVGAFKSGCTISRSLRPDAELIPVYLENLNRILPKGEVLPVPMLSRVVFGPPLTTSANEDKARFPGEGADGTDSVESDAMSVFHDTALLALVGGVLALLVVGVDRSAGC